MDVHNMIDADKKRKLGFRKITDNQKIVVKGFISGQDFLMVALTASGKSLIFCNALFHLVGSVGRAPVCYSVALVARKVTIFE